MGRIWVDVVPMNQLDEHINTDRVIIDILI